MKVLVEKLNLPELQKDFKIVADIKLIDEFTESMHSQLWKFEESHHYKNLKFGSESHARSQHKSILHINSINIC